MQTLDRLNGAALQNEMVTKRFHGLHPDPILYQKWQNLVLETAKMCVHDVQWHLHCVKMKPVLQSNFEHPEVNQRIFMSSEADVPDFARFLCFQHRFLRSALGEYPVRIFHSDNLVMLHQIDVIGLEALQGFVNLLFGFLPCPPVNLC